MTGLVAEIDSLGEVLIAAAVVVAMVAPFVLTYLGVLVVLDAIRALRRHNRPADQGR